MNPTSLSREDVEAVQRLRQLYPPHVLASLFDEGNSSLLSPARESVSSFSSGSVRSSVSSSPKTHHRYTGASHTSSIPAISERAVSPHLFVAQSFKAPSVSTVASRPQGLSRSVSDYAIREHALNLRSFPQQVAASTPVYFCVHCGNGFEKRADWETHEWIFHERQSFWPCPQPGCQAFFDSGRAFEAHHQAVHGCGRCDHASQVVELLPERKAWACGFKGCKEVFLDWSRRCKHVAVHYESLAKRQGDFRESPEWTYSTTIRNLLRQPELRDPFKKFMTKCHGHSKSGWPLLEWQPDKCAELQRCLEFRDFARGIPDVVHLAYRSGHPSYASSKQAISRPPTPPSGVLSPPAVSPRSSSLRSRSRARSQSIRSAMSASTMSPSSPPQRSSSGRSYLFDRKTSSSARISDPSSVISGQSYNAMSPPLSPPMTHNVSPMRTPVFPSATTELQRPTTATRRRMVAREPEVRGTSSMALLEFLREGPPTGPTKGEHRARRVPRAVPLMTDSYESGLGSAISSPSEEQADPMPPLPPLPIPVRKQSKPAYDFDRPISPVTEDDAEGRVSYDRPVSPLTVDHRDDQPQTQSPVSPAESEGVPTIQLEEPRERDELSSLPSDQPTIQETVIEFKSTTYQAQHYGHKILPPTPGPPPSQLLPLPPPPSFLPPTFAYPDTPTTESGDVPPSPMPPGFTDIANWPAPPPSVVPRTPTSPQLPEVPPMPVPIPEVSITVPQAIPVPQIITIPEPDRIERPRTATANSRTQHDIVKLMPPPKRARSSSRGRPRPLRWVSIGAIMDPPMPSPGVDFGNMISQPLDVVEPASQHATHATAINV